ncbi:MAG: DUF4249 domain-containing protein [Flavobacteriaceae bacterium]|nr:DUF4249 domain-containing protein [Flavobacteriaceae bacterium]
MKKNKILYIIFLFTIGLITSKCTEPFDIDEQLVFVDALVVEASITNAFKYHEIFLTRTFKFEEEGPKLESNAVVNIVDNAGNNYLFTEGEPGVYTSNIKFKAVINTDYQLIITTSDSKKYVTANIQLTNETQIDNLYATRDTNNFGNEVMHIKIESYDTNRNSNYYRYVYEETYKIIAPNWTNLDFVVLQDDEGNDLAAPGFGPRSRDERICYNSVISNSIIQISTTDLSEDRVSEFIVRSISADDAIISSRYSILVKQYVQSLEAYTYYDILNQLSGSSSLFAQIQPGFINSNIFSVDNKSEMVLGFFEMTSVSEKRIFFNYTDFFPNEDLPPYFIDCRVTSPPFYNDGGNTVLLHSIREGRVKFLEDNLNPGRKEGPYKTVPKACGDCTQLGSSEIPEFWIE